MRVIRESREFTEAVTRLAQPELVDQALAPIIDGLRRNPFGYPLFENDWCGVRYAQTEAIGDVLPPLVVAFTIEADNSVTLEWIEEDEPY
jgi:hypothetical protein